MGRIAGAILAGYALIGVLVVLTDQIFARTISGFATMATPPLYYFAVVTVTDALYSIAGGYLCAMLARDAARQATLGLMIFGEIMGVISAAASWNAQPHWFALLLLVLYPLGVWIGSKLRSRKASQSMTASV